MALTATSLIRDLRETARVQKKNPPKVAETVTVPSRMREDRAGGGIIASARRLTSADSKSQDKSALASAGGAAAWQTEAWELQREIGEQRFLSNTLAGRMAQAAFYVGTRHPDASPGTRPDPAGIREYDEILNAIGDGPSGFAQIINRLGLNLFVAGEGWIVGIPPQYVPGTPEYEAARAVNGIFQDLRPVDRTVTDSSEHNVLNLVWRMLSVTEFNVDRDGRAKFKLEDSTNVECSIDELYAIRVWRPDPEKAWEADSPTRSSLPVLRELLGLTMHISAQIDSRLAGAGLLTISTEASTALKIAAGMSPDDPRDPLMEALTTAMSAAIKDRSSPAALVPIVLTLPGEHVDKVKHLTFSTPLDKEAKNLRDEAIRRLALGQDAPPELLLGVASMNHWGAWLVREDVVKTHLEPPLALICDALTTQYLRPMLIATGLTPEQAENYLVWYDVDHLIERPNRSADAKDLYKLGEISGKTLRQATGFEDGDAPEMPAQIENDPAAALAMQWIHETPALLSNPGLPAVVEQVRALLAGEEATRRAAEEAEVSREEIAVTEKGESGRVSEQSTPETSPSDAPAGTPAAGGSA